MKYYNIIYFKNQHFKNQSKIEFELSMQALQKSTH